MRQGFLLILLVATMDACTTTTQVHDEGELASPDELGIEDPDPSEPSNQPAFCNPTGKIGDDLQKCLEHNETFYKDFDDEAKKREPWFNFPPDSWADSKEIDSKYVLPVVHEQEAVQRLEATPILELTSQEAQYFTGKPAISGGGKPYLVRGLLYFRETGAFAVSEMHGSILVQHDSEGASTPSETRSAVVVYLDAKPKNVYIDCAVAE